MEDLLNIIFSNPEALTPKSIEEFFVFLLVIEFIGMMFSWISGKRY